MGRGLVALIVVIVIMCLLLTFLGGMVWRGASSTSETGFRFPGQQALALAVAPVVPTQGTQPQSANQPLYGLPPQPQQSHAVVYLETGRPDPMGTDIDAHTKHWKFDLLADSVAVIGGFVVDGTSNGVYKGQSGPGTIDTIVTDGFVAVTTTQWGQSEWCFRLGQAKQYGWAMNTRTPLPNWTECK